MAEGRDMRLKLMAAALTLAPVFAAAQEAYPVIFSDAASQRELGVYNARFGPADGGSPLSNKCFYYGVHSQMLSLSDEFVAPYLARGFSVRTLCLAMVSGMTHHPETGARLATIIAADVTDPASPNVSDQIMVEVPDCFRRGLPLTDCAIRFGPDGAPLPEDVIADIAASGAAALAAGRALVADGVFTEPCGTPGGACFQEIYSDAAAFEVDPHHDRASPFDRALEPLAEGYFAREWTAEETAPELLPFGGFADFSPAYEEGFAYALFAYGGLMPFGPSEASITAESLALEGKNRANAAVIESLKIKVKE